MHVSEKYPTFAVSFYVGNLCPLTYYHRMITITFPDKSTRQYEPGTTPLQIAESISTRLAQDILAATVNGAEWDISRPIPEDAEI